MGSENMRNSVHMETVSPANVDAIADFLKLRAATHKNKAAIFFNDSQVTYGELYVTAKAIAAQLEQCAIKRGDRVALLYPNEPDYIAAFFAIVGLGAVVVPVNPLLKADEIVHILSDCEAAAIVVHESCLTEVMAALPATPTVKTVLVGRSAPASGETSPVGSTAIFHELHTTSGAEPSVAFPVTLNPDTDLALIVYTSGTTGKPKGAMLTHGNMLAIFPARLDMFDVDENDCFLATLPLCHIYGVSVVMIGTISRGASVVIQQKFDPKQTLENIAKHGITLLPMVPAMYTFLLMEMQAKQYDVSSVRIAFSGAAPLPVELINKIQKAFNAPVIEGYGLTETSCIATINPLHGKQKVGSVGPAVSGVRCEIMDEKGVPLPSGPENVGEIAVQGRNILLGYYKKPEATAEAIVKNWFYTGDLGYKDEDGYIYIVGRKKELILRGGQNIYPREIEEVIARMPGITEVAVIGVPDQYMGERVKAVVVTSDPQITADDVKAYCTKHLAEYKVPRLVEFMKALPRNSTGKILKRVLT